MWCAATHNGRKGHDYPYTEGMGKWNGPLRDYFLMFNRKTSLFLFVLFLLASGFSRAAGTLTVEVDGVNSEQEQNIRGMLSIQQLHEKEVASRSRLRFLHSKAKAEIRKALQPFGLYRPEIDAQLTEVDDAWLARYQVNPGEVLPIGVVDIQLLGESQDDQAFQKLLQDSPLQVGSALVHSEYETFKRQLLSLAAERGYFDAELIQNRVEVDLTRYQAAVIVHFNSGPRFHVGEVSFSPSPLADDFLLRYVPFEAGDPINNSALIDVQTALIDSDYFQQVEVHPLWDQAAGTEVPIRIDVEPNKKTKYRAGLGYGTDTGARAKLGVTKRWVNTRGHQFNAQLLTSEILSNFSTEYVIPGLNPQLDRYVFNASVSDENSDSIDAMNRSVGVSWQQQRGQWQQILALNFQQEEFTFGGETQETEFLIPRIAYNTVSTKDRLNVREGYRLSGQLQGASQTLLSDADFMQARVSGKAIYSLTPKLRVLGRMDAGMTLVDDFNDLPATLRFFAGGDNSVRGYDFQSLGPQDASGTVIGGPHLLVGSVELDYRLKEKWGVAAFVDSGNAFEDADIRLRTGVGVGLRWFSPIGPIRLDLAVPRGGDERGVQLHFSLGADL